MARKTKLTEEVQARIVGAIRDGNYIETASVCAGITSRTFFNWMSRGELGEEPYATFREEVEQAEALAEAEVVAVWKKAIPDNYMAAKDFLARRFPSRWGPKVTAEVKDDGKLSLADFIRECREAAQERERAELGERAEQEEIPEPGPETEKLPLPGGYRSLKELVEAESLADEETVYRREIGEKAEQG